MTSRSYLEGDRQMPAVPSTCAKQVWSGAERNQLPTFAGIESGRLQAAL